MIPPPDAEELGRFVVVSNNPEEFDVWLFDKRQQSDAIQKISLPVFTGAVTQLGAIIIAWQLDGTVLADF